MNNYPFCPICGESAGWWRPTIWRIRRNEELLKVDVDGNPFHGPEAGFLRIREYNRETILGMETGPWTCYSCQAQAPTEEQDQLQNAYQEAKKNGKTN
jgi:hypothetical protein